MVGAEDCGPGGERSGCGEIGSVLAAPLDRRGGFADGWY